MSYDPKVMVITYGRRLRSKVMAHNRGVRIVIFDLWHSLGQLLSVNTEKNMPMEMF